MKKLIIVSSIVLLSACGGRQDADAPVDTVEVEAPAEVMSLNETTWSFTMDGQDIVESIDAEGNYIANAGEAHFDHVTYVLKDGMQCFTSAMNDDGEECWTAPTEMAVGDSYEISSDKGQTLTVTRLEYQPMSM
jgi:hypothetical protein